MNYRTTSKLTAFLIGASILTLASAEPLNAKDPKIRKNSIKSSHLKTDSVTTAKIADGNVTTSKLANGSVTTSKVADGSITTSKVADGSVTIAKLDPSVPVAEENVSIVRGTLSGGAEALAGGGTGYTSVRNSVGNYTVTFTVPFSAAPTVVVTASSPNASTPLASATVASRTATGFVISIFRSDTLNPEDWHSNFIAIGSR